MDVYLESGRWDSSGDVAGGGRVGPGSRCCRGVPGLSQSAPRGCCRDARVVDRGAGTVSVRDQAVQIAGEVSRTVGRFPFSHFDIRSSSLLFTRDQ